MASPTRARFPQSPISPQSPSRSASAPQKNASQAQIISNNIKFLSTNIPTTELPTPKTHLPKNGIIGYVDQKTGQINDIFFTRIQGGVGIGPGDRKPADKECEFEIDQYGKLTLPHNIDPKVCKVLDNTINQWILMKQKSQEFH